MVGGIVIEVAERDGKIFIDVKDRHHKDTSAIWVEKNEDSTKIEIGDTIWWQGKWAMWTMAGIKHPQKCGVDFDIKIPRVGYSGAELDRSEIPNE